jgi:hypothetical protein
LVRRITSQEDMDEAIEWFQIHFYEDEENA